MVEKVVVYYMQFSIIAGVDDKMGLGKAGTLAWNLKADLKHFRDITVGAGNNAVIMGSNTWASIPEKFRPLPERLNIVLNREFLPLPPGVVLAGSIDEALAQAEQKQVSEIFVMGGANVYAQAVADPRCSKIYLTKIKGDFGCDVFFPNLPAGFKLSEQTETAEEGALQYQFLVYKKI